VVATKYTKQNTNIEIGQDKNELAKNRLKKDATNKKELELQGSSKNK